MLRVHAWKVWCCQSELELSTRRRKFILDKKKFKRSGNIDKLGAVLWNVWLSASPSLWLSRFKSKTRTALFWLSKPNCKGYIRSNFKLDYKLQYEDDSRSRWGWLGEWRYPPTPFQPIHVTCTPPGGDIFFISKCRAVERWIWSRLENIR